MRKIYLLTTSHLETCLWFRDDEDFKVAMNYIAIQAGCSPEVVVLAFILMSNHIHLVLQGEKEDVVAFVTQLKKRYSLYYRRKYGVKEFLRGNGLNIQPVPDEDEALERAIAYVQMNCVAANICAYPNQYRWGTGSTFFCQHPGGGRRLGDLSARARERLLRSELVHLPDQWLVCQEGYILPQSYVDVEFVENCFRTPRRMIFFQNNSSKAKRRIETKEAAFRDQIILPAIQDLCRSLFQKESFSALTEEEQSEFAKQIRFRFNSDVNQIARVCGITYADAAKLLDRV